MSELLDLNEHDERAIANFMSRVATLPIPGAETLSTPLRFHSTSLEQSAQLWWKAQLLKKWDAQRRAQQPLDVMHRIEIASSLVAAGVVLYWTLPYLL